LKLNMSKFWGKRKKILNTLGSILILSSLFFLFLIFFPAIKQEIRYDTKNITKIKKDLTPPNTDFSIVIPKIEAVAPIFANTDPFNPSKYIPILYKGVAHAVNTSFPGEDGNVYLFAHSTDSFLNVSRYNAVFYLLGKLEQGDEIKVYYKDREYIYIVQEKKIVAPSAVEYLKGSGEKTLTLQTCYPPGTTLKRLIVIAKEKE